MTGGPIKDVLVVDDEAVARSFLARVVEKCGLVPVQASTLAEARALLHRPFLCALFDKNLPDGSGLTVMAELHVRAPRMPKVLVTAFLDAQSAVTAVRAGAIEILNKPPDVASLKTVLDAVVERARVEAAQAEAIAALVAEVDRARLHLAALGAPAAKALSALDAARDAATLAGLNKR